MLIYDRATTWIDCYPVRTQSADDVYNKFINFIGPLQEIKYVHSDDSAALKASLKDLRILHDQSIPARPKTNGVAERQVKEVVHGVRALLKQAGLPHCFWPYDMRNFCFARNIKIKRETGESAHHRRFGKEFQGKRIPFGALVEYLPSPIYQRKLNSEGRMKFDAARPGVSLGYKVLSGGRWRDGMFVIDLGDIAKMNLTRFS